MLSQKCPSRSPGCTTTSSSVWMQGDTVANRHTSMWLQAPHSCHTRSLLLTCIIPHSHWLAHSQSPISCWFALYISQMLVLLLFHWLSHSLALCLDDLVSAHEWLVARLPARGEGPTAAAEGAEGIKANIAAESPSKRDKKQGSIVQVRLP